MKPADHEQAQAKQGRTVALVIACTFVLWLIIQYAGSQLGWSPRYVFLADFAALAALFWALVVTVQIWRKRNNDHE